MKVPKHNCEQLLIWFGGVSLDRVEINKRETKVM